MRKFITAIQSVFTGHTNLLVTDHLTCKWSDVVSISLVKDLQIVVATKSQGIIVVAKSEEHPEAPEWVFEEYSKLIRQWNKWLYNKPWKRNRGVTL